MSLLTKAIATMEPELAESFMKWLSDRPPVIQELAHRIPPRMRITIEGCHHWVVGYAETGNPEHAHLLVADVNPGVSEENYEIAMKTCFSLCPIGVVISPATELN